MRKKGRPEKILIKRGRLEAHTNNKQWGCEFLLEDFSLFGYYFRKDFKSKD